jgi:hypothetical protein
LAKERSIEERINLGDWAKNLLENPNFIGVCNGIVLESMQGLLSATPGSDQAKQLHMELLSADRFKSALKVLENDAAMARDEIKRRKQYSGTP